MLLTTNALTLHLCHVTTNGVAWSTCEENAGKILMDSRAACDYSSGVIAVNIWLATSTRLPRAVDQPKRGSRGWRQAVS